MFSFSFSFANDHSSFSTHRFPSSPFSTSTLSLMLPKTGKRDGKSHPISPFSRQASRGVALFAQHQCNRPPAKAGDCHEKRLGRLRLWGLEAPKSKLAGAGCGPKRPKRQSSPQSCFCLQRPCQQYFKFSQETGARFKRDI